MFKAKLIEKSDYYFYRRMLILTSLIPLIASLFSIAQFHTYSIWISKVILGIYLITIILMIVVALRIKYLTNKRSIEIDDNNITIRHLKTNEIVQFPIDETSQIRVKKTYDVPHDSFGKTINEIKGDQVKNFITITNGDKSKKMDFLSESNYMIIQLEKVVKNWINKGYNVQKV